MRKANYTADNIQVLKDLKAVRKRPAMYIGDTGEYGLHHLITEVVDNSIDEAISGYCTWVQVFLLNDSSVLVSDNGRGIPTEIHKGEQKPAVEVVMTTLHSGGKFDEKAYSTSGGLHGVGVSCVNALSSQCIVSVFRKGKHVQIRFAEGITKKKMRTVKKVVRGKTGTVVQWWADPKIFPDREYDLDHVATALKELAYLNSGLRIDLYDLRQTEKRLPHSLPKYYRKPAPQTFKFKHGIKDWVTEMCAGEEVIVPPQVFSAAEK